MVDLLIRGGQVVDGTGTPGRLADVAIHDGRIVAVGPGAAGRARRVIDASGQMVSPGFIDIKTHSDFTLPLTPRAESRVHQGVTTEVIGHCGFSTAPVLAGRVALLRDYLSPFAPWLPIRETTFREYMETFPATAVNVVMQVGHNTLRLMVLGMEDRAPTGAEMGLMQKLLEEALDAGALGMSSGLFTPPGSYARPDEMITLGRVLRRLGGWYATHIRDEATGVFEAVQEAIAVGKTCGIPVEIVHMKLSGIDNWGKARQLLAEIEAARARGLRVGCDHYPYTAAGNPLRNLLPMWAQDGGLDAMLCRLTEPATRQRIREELARRGLTGFGRVSSWEAVRLAMAPRQPEYVGLTIGELARRGSGDPVDALCDCLIADRGETYVLITTISEDDVRELLRTPFVLIGSDGRSVAPDNVTGQGKPHPRFYGTFPRVLGHYVRELGLLSLPAAIHKMTGGPASVLGLRSRGLVREGYCADITIFDPQTIADRATYDDPHQYPVGISSVIVNGEVVVDSGAHTGALPGRVLRRGPDGVG
jgi:N-acyl-D-amino-acid deacylase